MSLLQAIVLGVVQGLTEFLPISSTAHLVLVPKLLGWRDPGAAFSAVIQIGTLVAVLAYFRRDIVSICMAVLRGLTERKPLGTAEARLGWMIAAGTVPIVVCGLLGKEQIKTSLRSLYVMCAMLIAVGILMELAERYFRRRLEKHLPQTELDHVSWRDAIIIGLAQALALVPGTSRSGVTISAGLLRNFSRPTAARFSFLLSLPSIFAAGIYQLISAWEELTSQPQDARNLVVATVVAALVGYAAIAFLLRYLRTRGMRVFVVYRLLLAAAILLLLFTGRITPESEHSEKVPPVGLEPTTR